MASKRLSLQQWFTHFRNKTLTESQFYDRLNHFSLSDVSDETGMNLLHWAATNGDAHFIQPLIQAGQDFNQQDSSGWTPLMCAIYYQNTSCLRNLLLQGADPFIFNDNNENALKIGVQLDHISCVSLLIEHHPSLLTAKDKSGWTALMWAAFYDSGQSLNFLLNQGADPFSRNLFQKTALDIAQERQHHTVADQLKSWMTYQHLEPLVAPLDCSISPSLRL